MFCNIFVLDQFPFQAATLTRPHALPAATATSGRSPTRPASSSTSAPSSSTSRDLGGPGPSHGPLSLSHGPHSPSHGPLSLSRGSPRQAGRAVLEAGRPQPAGPTTVAPTAGVALRRGTVECALGLDHNFMLGQGSNEYSEYC